VILRYLLDTKCALGARKAQAGPWRRPCDGSARARGRDSNARVHELWYGCVRLPATERRKKLTEYLLGAVRAAVPLLPYDEAAATWHAEERARLAALGRMPSAIDGAIAAIARVNDLTLVTAIPATSPTSKGCASSAGTPRRPESREPAALSPPRRRTPGCASPCGRRCTGPRSRPPGRSPRRSRGRTSSGSGSASRAA